MHGNTLAMPLVMVTCVIPMADCNTTPPGIICGELAVSYSKLAEISRNSRGLYRWALLLVSTLILLGSSGEKVAKLGTILPSSYQNLYHLKWCRDNRAWISTDDMTKGQVLLSLIWVHFKIIHKARSNVGKASFIERHWCIKMQSAHLHFKHPTIFLPLFPWMWLRIENTGID